MGWYENARAEWTLVGAELKQYLIVSLDRRAGDDRRHPCAPSLNRAKGRADDR
jgi:hypothetical protein